MYPILNSLDFQCLPRTQRVFHLLIKTAMIKSLDIILIEYFIEINVYPHEVLWIQRSLVYFSQFSQWLHFVKLWYNIIIRILILIHSTNLICMYACVCVCTYVLSSIQSYHLCRLVYPPSQSRCWLLLAFYNHSHLLPSSLHSIPNFCQPVNNLPFLKFHHIKNVA